MNTVLEKVQAIVAQYTTDIQPVITRPEPEFGDYTTNVALQLAGRLSRNPRELAVEIAAELEASDEFATVTVAGPGFINIKLKDETLYKLAYHDKQGAQHYGTVVIETNNPNPFKAMHIGHALNAITADAIANLLDVSAEHVYRVSYHGDVGLHVGKSMYALLNYVEGDAGKLNEVPAAERNSFMSRMYAEGSRAYKEDEAAKARPVPTHQAPENAKDQQGQHHLSQYQVPVHGIAAHLGGDDQGHDANRQQPVKQAGGQVPDPDSVNFSGGLFGGLCHGFFMADEPGHCALARPQAQIAVLG